NDRGQGLISSGTDLQSTLRVDPAGFPFRSELSLKPLIDFWMRPTSGRPAIGALAPILPDKIMKIAGELDTITDPSSIERHRKIVDVLMAAVFPSASWEFHFGAAM